VLGTVAWSTVADSVRGHAAAGRAALAIYLHGLATGFSRGFEVAAGIMILALIITVAAIRVRRDGNSIRAMGMAPGIRGRDPAAARPVSGV
jgi:hypothetical protein